MVQIGKFQKRHVLKKETMSIWDSGRKLFLNDKWHLTAKFWRIEPFSASSKEKKNSKSNGIYLPLKKSNNKRIQVSLDLDSENLFQYISMWFFISRSFGSSSYMCECMREKKEKMSERFLLLSKISVHFLFISSLRISQLHKNTINRI